MSENTNTLTNKIENLLENNLIYNQTLLVEELLKKEIFSYEDIINLYDETDEEAPKEIMSWYLITDWFADKLKSKNEAVLESDFGTWWGRTTYGQGIIMDAVIQEIAKEL